MVPLLFSGYMPQQMVSPTPTKHLVNPAGFDPEAQPVVAVFHDLSPLRNESLQLDFIRAAFRRPVAWQVEPVFTESFNVDAQAPCAEIVRAAVCLPLVQRQKGLNVILTRRSLSLSDHGGQIAFPGGRIETFDASPVEAALRETWEEIGVSREFIQILGTQPGFLTSTRFAMKPVIAYVMPGFSVRPDPSEVSEVFEVPLGFLMNPAHHTLHLANLPGGGHRYYFAMRWGDYFIWGATAALLRNFYHYLSAAERG